MFAGNGPHNYDLTIVSHVEPFDLVKFTEPDYYLGYNNEAFNALYKQIVSTPDEAGRAKLLGDAQRMLATDAVAGFLYQPQLITITNKKLKGVWKDVPAIRERFLDVVLGVGPRSGRICAISVTSLPTGRGHHLAPVQTKT